MANFKIIDFSSFRNLTTAIDDFLFCEDFDIENYHIKLFRNSL